MARWTRGFLIAAALAAGCQSPPQSECRSQPGEDGISIDCPQPKDDWSERASEEAVEGMDERAPGSRP